MPTVNIRVFEESKRHQLISEYQISPMQAAEQIDYQVKISGIPSLFKEDAKLAMKELLSHWAESQGSIWSKLPRLLVNTPQILYSFAGNPSASSVSNGTNTFIQWHGASTTSFHDTNVIAIPFIYEARGYTINGQSGHYAMSSTQDLASNTVTFYAANDVIGIWIRNTKDGILTQTNLEPNFATGWRNFKITATPTLVSFSWTGQTTYSGNISLTIPTVNLGLTMTVNTQLEQAWSFVRKYASPEPVIQKLRTLNRSLIIKHLGKAG